MVLLQINNGNCQTAMKCSFKDLSIPDYDDNIHYTCDLQEDFPFINADQFNIIGDHFEGNFDTDVGAFAVDSKKLYQIPNFSTKFINLEIISIKNSGYRNLRRENIEIYREKLLYLAITESEIQIIHPDTFTGLESIEKINLSKNNIFYIAAAAFDEIPIITIVQLQGNKCQENGQDIPTCTGPECSAIIATFTCGTPNIENFIFNFVELEMDLLQSEEYNFELQNSYSELNESFSALSNEVVNINTTLNILQDAFNIFKNNFAIIEEILVKINEDYTKADDLLIYIYQNNRNDTLMELDMNTWIINKVFSPINDNFEIFKSISSFFTQYDISIENIISYISSNLETFKNIYEKISSELDNFGDIIQNLIEEGVTFEDIIIRLTQNCSGSNEDLDELIANYTILQYNYTECMVSLRDSDQTHSNDQNKIRELESTINDLTKINEDLEWEAEQCQDINGTCRFSSYQDYGYSCIARNLTITNVNQTVEWSGDHKNKSLTNSDVRGLIIREQEVDVIPNNIGTVFTSLEVLIIDKCGLQKLERANFAGLEKLKDIQFTSNKITSVESGTFDSLTMLVNINLSENNIEYLPSKIFALLAKLVTLDLSSNQLTTVKSDFIPTTTSIKLFSAANNDFTIVDTVFVYRLRNADVIDFSGNRCNQKYEATKEAFVDFYTKIMKNC